MNVEREREREREREFEVTGGLIDDEQGGLERGNRLCRSDLHTKDDR